MLSNQSLISKRYGKIQVVDIVLDNKPAYYRQVSNIRHKAPVC